MNKEIMKNLGFEKEVKCFEKRICVICKKEIVNEDFRDKLSLKEYQISGMCQECQDEIFGV